MKNRTHVGLLIGFLLMTTIAVVFGYLYYHERSYTRQQEEVLEERVTELVTAEMKLDSISRQLDLRIAQVRKLGGSLIELEKAKAQLEKDRAQLRKGTMVMRSKIEEYETFLTRKDGEIARLSEENKTLTAKNQTLATVNSTLQEEKELLSDSLLEVITRTSDLEDKVNRAAILRARDVKVFAISARGREREGEEVRARRVDNIRVDFMLEKNPLTRLENKVIYVKILDPNGATLSDASLGSGLFDYQGQEVTFTLSKEVPYTNTNQKVSVLYNRTQPFLKGTYRVELFSEGYQIGEGSFSIK
jgi:hypothetical protein